jgi:lipid-A-disaccharide synthase-like uncharacterized protein
MAMKVVKVFPMNFWRWPCDRASLFPIYFLETHLFIFQLSVATALLPLIALFHLTEKHQNIGEF